MERLSKGLRSLAEDAGSNSSSFRGSDFPSPAQSQIVLHRAQRQVVSLWTCSKACAISFTVGVFVGFTLKRRLRRWATKLLKKWKDD